MKSSYALAGVLIGMLLLVVISLPPTGHSLKLAATGDLMLGRGVASAHANGNWEQALAAIAPHIATADLAFANLESPITAAPLIRATYDLRAPPQATLALSVSGIDLLSLANNHIGDSGPSGIADTLQALNIAGVVPIGPDETPLIIHTRGLRLAWFAFNDILQPIQQKSIQAALSSVRNQVNLVVVSIHWGSEVSSFPTQRQRSLANVLADAGADIILGHHPHVLQPVDWIWGAGRGRSTFVAYSLGNALFDQGAPPNVRQSALLMIAVDRLGVQNACVVPFQIDPETWDTTMASPPTTDAIVRQVQLIACK